MCLQGLMKYHQYLIKALYVHKQKPLRIQREIILTELVPSLFVFIISICLVNMNEFERFDEIPSMTLQDIKETKRFGWTDTRTVIRTENLKTVFPPTNTICRGMNTKISSFKSS